MVLKSIEQSYQIQQLTEERLYDLFRLFKSSKPGFHKSFNYYKEKYNTSHTGLNFIGYLAYDLNGIPAAFYGVLPVMGILNGELMLIGQSADTITHPKHQKKGLFIFLATKTYKLAQEKGVKFLFGLPNSNSYPGFINKLAWEHQDDIGIYYSKIPQFPIAKFFQIHWILKMIFGFYTNFLTWIFWNNSIISLSDKKQENNFNKLQILHDFNYLNYKKYGGKFFRIRLSKYSELILKVQGKVKIGCLSDDFELNKKFLMKLKIFAFMSGCDEIEFKSNEVSKSLEHFLKQRKGSSIITKFLDQKQKDQRISVNYFDFDTF
jgi:hypothetical protein